MATYIVLLRGINVSGHNKIKMADLKLLLIELGFSNITTYIQSGNVILKSNQTESKNVEQRIIEAIKVKYGYGIKALVLTKSQLKSIFASNPFFKRKNIDIVKLHVTLLRNEPDLIGKNLLEKFKLTNGDEFELIDKNVYLYCPNGYGRTKLTNNLIEKKLNCSATTRNWKTITKLVELSDQ